MSRVLKDKIVSGESIDKPFLDKLNPEFWKEISDKKYGENLNRFITSLNSDIEYQKDYGILKTFSEMRNDVTVLAKELIEAIDKEIKRLDKEMEL